MKSIHVSLIESLLDGFGLFQIEDQQPIFPGQWISVGDQHYPVFKSDHVFTFFIAPISHFEPSNEQNLNLNKIKIHGEIFDWGILKNDALGEADLILLADGDAIATLFHFIYFLIERWGIKSLQKRLKFIILGNQHNFIFKPVPSLFILPEFPSQLIASAQLLEDLKLPTRLALQTESPGCYLGTIGSLLSSMKGRSIKEHHTTVVSFGNQDFISDIKKLLDGEPCKQFYNQSPE